MNIQDKIDPSKIDYLSIKLLGGGIKFDQSSTDSDIKLFESVFKGSNNKVDFEAKIISMVLDLNIYILNHEDKRLPVEASYIIEHTFRIDNFEDFIVPDEKGKTYLDMVLGNTLMGIAYSTTRGIVFTRLQGTIYDSYILPVIKPVELLNNMAELGFKTAPKGKNKK